MTEFSGFTEKANKALNTAMETAMSLGHTYIGSEHILYALTADENCVGAAVLANQNIDGAKILTRLETLVGKGIVTRLTLNDFTPRSRRILENAASQTKLRSGLLTGTENILRAIVSDEKSYGCIYLKEMGTDLGQIYKECSLDLSGIKGKYSAVQAETVFKAKSEKNEYLSKYGRDLTEIAAAGGADPLIDRDDEIQRIIQTLLRRRKNNPCLIGESGVGKTAIIEGLAMKIVEGKVPDEIKGKRIFMLDLTSMLAGAKYRGDFEERIKNAVDEIIKDKNTILFIDEVHNIVGTGAAEGAVDAANILKPLLARGEFQLIGATTYEEYRKFIEKDGALERRFQPISVGEPSEEMTQKIIFGLREKYEAHHKISISDEAVRAAVKLSVRYLPDRFLPDKAIDLIDEAASRQRISTISTPPLVSQLRSRKKELSVEKLKAISEQDYEKAACFRDEEKSIIEKLNALSLAEENERTNILMPEHIAEVISKWTGIPKNTIESAEIERLLRLESDLKREIIGQDEAIATISGALKRSRTGFSDVERPIGTFIFLGPTGVGKTQVCKTLSSVFFGNEKSLIRLDMSEFMEQHSVSKLIGSPPGYVGYESGGMLVEKLRKQPYSVVLFDEIEKAHKDVLNILLQILEDGTLTAADGRKASFKNAVVIMTGNVGGAEITSKSKNIGFGESDESKITKERVEKRLRETFTPEFLNRIDETVIFNRLSYEQTVEICKKMLLKTTQRAAEQGIALNFTKRAVEEISRLGFDEKNGARPLRRIISSRVEKLLSERMLEKKLEKNTVVDFSDGNFLIKQLQTERQSDKI